jgi:ABC-type bacteriocin/lantibiotic exporter with double-glycine peptidase domain
MNSPIVDSIFTVLKAAEELAYPDAKILNGFRRVIQLDGYSCGARATQAVLAYFGIHRSPRTIERKLRTTWEGTDASDIAKVLRAYGLVVRIHRKMSLQDIRKAIDSECPIICTTWDNEHYVACHGISNSHIFVMNPSLDASSTGVGAIWCAVTKQNFKKMWDKYGMVVARPQ